MIHFVDIPIGHGLACACVQCGSHTEREFHAAEIVALQVGEAVGRWRGPGPNVLFTGPEPFAHPQLPEIIASAARSGVERIALRTDAGALSMPGNAEGVLAAGVRQLQVVMLAGAAHTNDTLASRAGLFDAAKTGVANFLAAARASHTVVAVTGLIPVCAHNLVHLPATVGVLAGAGAVAVEIAVSSGVADGPESAGWIAAAIDTGLVNGVWVSATGVQPSRSEGVGLHAITPFSLSVDAS